MRPLLIFLFILFSSLALSTNGHSKDNSQLYIVKKQLGACIFKPATPCLCQQNLTYIDNSDGPHHGKVVRVRNQSITCPNDIHKKLSDAWLGNLNANTTPPPSGYSVDFSLRPDATPMDQFWAKSFATGLANVFTRHQDNRVQQTIDQIRSWNPPSQQMINDVRDFRADHLNAKNELSAVNQSMHNYLKYMIEVAKNPKANNPIPYSQRPTPIPKELNAKEVKSYFSKLYNLANSGNIRELHQQIQRKIDQMLVMSKRESQFYRQEFVRVFLTPDMVFKELPYSQNPGIRPRSKLDSPEGRFIRKKLNALMAAKSQLNTLLRASCAQKSCDTPQDYLVVSAVHKRFNQLYSDLQRLDRASNHWEDTQVFEDYALKQIDQMINAANEAKSIEDLYTILKNDYEVERSKVSGIAGELEEEFKGKNLASSSPQFKTAEKISSITNCLTLYSSCKDEGQLKEYLSKEEQVGPLSEIQKIENNALALLRSKKKVEDSNSSKANPDFYKFSQAFFTVAGGALGTGQDTGDNLVQTGKEISDIALGLIPGVSVAKDMYEAVTGTNLVTGKKLTDIERGLAILGVATLGSTSSIKNAGRLIFKVGGKFTAYGGKFLEASKASYTIARKTLGSARRLFGKSVSKAEINGFSNLSKQILRGDADGIAKLDKIVTSAKNVSPKLGNKYVKELPDLKGSIKEAFEGHIYKGSYKPGEVIFQAQRAGQTGLGRWFAPVKPINSEHAESMLNIKKWGNNADEIKVYKVKESVSGYSGKVAGGDGHQFLIPSDIPLEDVLEEIIF